MWGQTSFLSIIFLIILIVTDIVKGQEETQCRGHDINFTPEQRNQLIDCLKVVGITSIWKIPADKLACFGLCVLEKKKLLTEDGKLDKPKILAYIELVMRPEEVKVLLKDAVSKCMDDFGDKVRGNGQDVTCMSFMEVGQCVHDSFLDICIED